MPKEGRTISRRQLLKVAGVTAIGGVLAACAGGERASAVASDRSAVAPTSSLIRLRLQIEVQQAPAFEKVAAGFKADVAGMDVTLATVDRAVAGGDWVSRALAAGSADLILAGEPTFQSLDPLLKLGALAPLDHYATWYGWENKVLAAALQHSSRSGKLWALPLYCDLCGVAYRKSTLVGLQTGVPQTWEAFVTLLEKARAKGLIPLTFSQRTASQSEGLHTQLWASTGGVSGGGSMTDVIFSTGRFTDLPAIRAAQGMAELFARGLVDPDAALLSEDETEQRFLEGKAALYVTGTELYPKLNRSLGDDWDLFTAPGPGGKPVWAMSESAALLLPKDAKQPDAAAHFLDYCLAGNGCRVLRASVGVLSSSAFAEMALPQVQHLPGITREQSSLQVSRWLPPPSLDAYRQGLWPVVSGRLSPEQWTAGVQAAWEQDVQTGNVPADRGMIPAYRPPCSCSVER